MTPVRRLALPIALGAILLATATACDDSNSYGSYYSAPIRTVAQQKPTPAHVVEAFDLGPMMVDDQGFTLYRYDRDGTDPPTSNCAGACAEVWKPVRASGPAGTEGARLGTTVRRDGTEQLTVGGWPVYRYTKDEMPGDTRGHGVSGSWFPVRPDGGKVPAAQALPDTRDPVSDTDAELLVKVRLAGLWEMPSSRWAWKRGGSPRVREIGLRMLVDHGRLDTMVRAAAERFDVPLPNEPSVKQQTWLNEMRDADSAAEFDRIFANRARLAHGKVLTYIANVRAGSRNEAIRAFANTGNTAVLRHINLLESTGLVDYADLPAPVLDASATAAGAALSIKGTDVFFVVLLVALLGAGTVLALRFVRGAKLRGPRRPRKPTTTGD